MSDQSEPTNLKPKDLGYPWENFKPWQVVIITGFAVLLGIFCLLSAHYEGWEWLFYFLILGGLLLFALITVKPRIGMYIMALLVMIEHETFYPLVNSKVVFFWAVPATIFIIITIPGWVLNKYAQVYPKRKFHPLDIPFFLLVVLGGASCFWAYSETYAFYWWCMLVFNYAMWFLMTALINDEKSLRRVYFWTIIGAIAIALGCVISFIWQLNLAKTYDFGKWRLLFAFKIIYKRAGGLAGSNHAAFSINIALGLVVASIFRAKRMLWKLFYFLIASFYIYGIVLTQSRTGTCCSLIILILLSFLYLRWREDIVRNAFFAVALVLFIMVLGDLSNIRGNSFFGRYEAVVSSSSGQVTGIGVRIQWWKEGIKFELEHDNLLWGMGLGGMMWNVDLGPDINSVYLCYLLELGVVGCFLFLYTVIVFWRCLAPLIKYSLYHRSYLTDMFLGLCASFVGTVIIQGLVEYDFYGRIVWFAIGMLMVTGQLVKNEMENPPPNEKQELESL